MKKLLYMISFAFITFYATEPLELITETKLPNGIELTMQNSTSCNCNMQREKKIDSLPLLIIHSRAAFDYPFGKKP